MRFLISGSTGFLGSALATFLHQHGYDVIGLVRHQKHPIPEIVWDPAKRILNTDLLEGFDVVVHLAGENIAQRWTPKNKQAIRDSRVLSTSFLCENLATLKKPPHVLISSSATGYYGDRGDEILDEESPAGCGFLASLCQEWEAATRPAENAGIRVVHLRTGVVLSAGGGALKKMLPPFRLGLGATLGEGSQYMSWISLEDWLRIIPFLALTSSITGPVNAVAPQPVTNNEFTRALAQAVGKRSFLHIPKSLLRLALGELADEALLISQRVFPAKLAATGFVFERSHLQEALVELTEISD